MWREQSCKRWWLDKCKRRQQRSSRVMRNAGGNEQQQQQQEDEEEEGHRREYVCVVVDWLARLWLSWRCRRH